MYAAHLNAKIINKALPSVFLLGVSERNFPLATLNRIAHLPNRKFYGKRFSKAVIPQKLYISRTVLLNITQGGKVTSTNLFGILIILLMHTFQSLRGRRPPVNTTDVKGWGLFYLFRSSVQFWKRLYESPSTSIHSQDETTMKEWQERRFKVKLLP